MSPKSWSTSCLRCRSSDSSCTDVSWLGGIDFATRLTHCNGAVRIHAGEGNVGVDTKAVAAANCVRVNCASGTIAPVMLLTKTSSVPSPVNETIDFYGDQMNELHFFGGTAAISAGVRTAILDRVKDMH